MSDGCKMIHGYKQTTAPSLAGDVKLEFTFGTCPPCALGKSLVLFIREIYTSGLHRDLSVLSADAAIRLMI